MVVLLTGYHPAEPASQPASPTQLDERCEESDPFLTFGRGRVLALCDLIEHTSHLGYLWTIFFRLYRYIEGQCEAGSKQHEPL
jgi:hypothetical protein